MEEEGDDALGSALLEIFMKAQAKEDRDDVAAAAALYERLIAKAEEEVVTPTPSSVTDEALLAASLAGSPCPPASLIVSTALTSLGGLHLDASRLAEARSAFLRSLSWWPNNAMALINLGDLEREHGSLARGLEHYASAAALPPLPTEGEEEGSSEDGSSKDGSDDEGSESEGSEESDQGDAHPAWFDSWVASPRLECASISTYMCALLYHQAQDFGAAVPYLRRFAGVRLRLSPAVWQLAANRPQPPPKASDVVVPASTHPNPSDPRSVRRFDGAVPPELLERLQLSFAIDSPFWKETGYAARGYFSFWYDVRRAPTNAVEALARHLLHLTGSSDDIVGCEWWVHTRPEGRSIGHQMHFDTEESSLAEGEILHPVVSTVTYINGSATGGDPTVVLQQRVHDDKASSVSVSHPVIGSTLFFPGDLLHCVVPTTPLESTKACAAPSVAVPSKKRGRAAAGLDTTSHSLSQLTPSSASPQRVTLMMGFWTCAVNARCPRPLYGACGPTPRATRHVTWPENLAWPRDERESRALHERDRQTQKDPEAIFRTTPCRQVPAVEGSPWQRIPEGRGATQGGSETEGSYYTALPLPEARNQRFFVSAVSEFREQIVHPHSD